MSMFFVLFFSPFAHCSGVFLFSTTFTLRMPFECTLYMPQALRHYLERVCLSTERFALRTVLISADFLKMVGGKGWTKEEWEFFFLKKKYV